jgi:hypothetical protein
VATESAQRLAWEQALAWRMRRHHLVERAAPRRLLRVVGDIGGLHAQVMSSAELSLWARIDRLSRDAVDNALWKRRTLVKLWAMRGTLHLLPGRELGMWLSALGTITNRGMTGYPEIDQLSEAIGKVLAGRILTREELAAEVERATGSAKFAEWIGFSWGSYLKPACFRGRLCFAASDDGRARFTSPESWLGTAIDQPDPEDALREVTRRFLSAYAPGTKDDLALWTGFGRARCRKLLAALGDEAVEVDVDDAPAWVLARDVRRIASTQPTDVARLLPAFDQWTIGATRRHAAFLDPRHHARIYRPQGWISPVLLVNGRMVGVWRHARKGARLQVELEPFGRLPSWARAQLEVEAARLAQFLDAELELKVVRSASGPGARPGRPRRR